MTDETLQRSILKRICALKEEGSRVVIVHGGGPFIKAALAEAQIESEFIDGHRKTSAEALRYVEMALKGRVNGHLVSLINALGHRAVGLSGKDGGLIRARKRWHQRAVNGQTETVDLGQVGDVAEVKPELLELLLQQDFIPVITCLADDAQGNSYNINGDMFAGHLAGALQASQYIILTDVDGLLRDRKRPETIIRDLSVADLEPLIAEGVIQGGMLPKMESCAVALSKGAQAARILNGTQPEQLAALATQEQVGTRIQA